MSVARLLPVAEPEGPGPELFRLLAGSSRTFALTIPLLPPPLREVVSLAYLLLRNADTLEDAWRRPREQRMADLHRLMRLLRTPGDREAARSFAASFEDVEDIDDPGHVEVLLATPFLMETLTAQPPELREVIVRHVSRTASAMVGWVARHDPQGRLSLRRLRETDEYCYAVAGIVGEMVTELIELCRDDLDEAASATLHACAVDFGLGLQLVNIVKDARRDAGEGRRYLPARFLPLGPGASAARLGPVLDLARDRLDRGIRYALALPEAAVGERRFCLVPLYLAAATLDEVEARTEELFAGADVKISRARTIALVARAVDDAASDEAIRASWAELRRR